MCMYTCIIVLVEIGVSSVYIVCKDVDLVVCIDNLWALITLQLKWTSKLGLLCVSVCVCVCVCVCV